jgi:pyruvate dehydrogenase E2 component (dihydrolipoamide acetyltransferase)
MPVPVIMPKLEMSQETAVIVNWLKRDGDAVKKGEPIMTVETDKVTVEIESTGEGILREISAKVGDIVPVTTVVAYIYQSDEKPAAASLLSAPIPEAPLPAPLSSGSPSSAPFPTLIATRMAAAEEVKLTQIAGSDLAGRVMKSDEAATIGQKRRASPSARRVAREKNILLENIEGSGPLGRIQTPDVLKAHAQVSSPVVHQSAAPEVIPLRGMRRTIAERVQTSYQTTPHISFTTRVDTTALEQLRMLLDERLEQLKGPHISLTILFIKIVAHTLRQHQWINSTLRGDEILLLPFVNIGVVVALPEGLIVPVIQNADQKGIETLAEEVNDLTLKARQNKLQATDVSNGTFTISNLGPFGIEQFSAIINPGQAAILAIGASQPEVVPINGRPEIRPILRMTLSVDHRIVDGAVAAHFMMDLKSALEFPSQVLW